MAPAGLAGRKGCQRRIEQTGCRWFVPGRKTVTQIWFNLLGTHVSRQQVVALVRRIKIQLTQVRAEIIASKQVQPRPWSPASAALIMVSIASSSAAVAPLSTSSPGADFIQRCLGSFFAALEYQPAGETHGKRDQEQQADGGDELHRCRYHPPFLCRRRRVGAGHSSPPEVSE